MSDPSLHQLDHCPSCQKSLSEVDWFTWCSKCGVVVCSECSEKVHDCKDGYTFGVGRGTRYFNTLSLHEDSHENDKE